MQGNITDDELRILTLMHDRAGGYDSRFQLSPREFCDALNIDDQALIKCTSYLAQHNLVGLQTMDVSRLDNPNQHVVRGIWLTGLGEDFMRELEKQPNVPKKLTLVTLKGAAAAVKDVAVQVLGAYLATKV